MMALKVATSLILVLLSAVICTGHPDGADDQACKDLYPSHGYTAKSAAEGHADCYRLVQDTEDYKPGDVITVTLSSEASPFMGFLIKAFDENEKDVGSFRAPGPTRGHSATAPVSRTPGGT
ncbi:secreted protein, putative [Ixodes scapularis]|uniref:Secreted protein, putative n=1 Tax=Ixodes scapularis TaxID=6945 RepID=B7PHH7_IXOSC|nr:secreted protein, putative [Ixodes scapularis]|eukprot:XP_002402852.1 secreted protein, putative [Ixodes scapularis]